MPESILEFSDFPDLLKLDGPVAVILKQTLAPVNEDDPIIFPPTYPMTTFKGRVHTIHDGEYRVSVELPAIAKREKEKGEKESEQASGYNIDRFPDGTNSCEIDSPQSQANRIEPMFKLQHHDLVPQIKIKVGNDADHGTIVNLLDAGHRAGDALVRMSSLADDFHKAFVDAGRGNYFSLAKLAPTSLLFGVWDSRSTQVKIQRILKASIRASNVRECTRSAQFTPAADYVASAAVTADLDKGEGDQNPLSSEGMQHALAVQKIGGVMLTSGSTLARTVNVNLVALRALSAGKDAEQSRSLQLYVLGLALVAATSDQPLNLREGCHLRIKDQTDTYKLIPRRGEGKAIKLDPSVVMKFAMDSAKAFFKLADIPFDKKDHLDAVFETGVAEEFLAIKDKKDRDKVRKLGPITAATLKKFRDQGNDPFKSLMEVIKTTREELAKGNKKILLQIVPALNSVITALNELAENSSLPDEVKVLASEIVTSVSKESDAHATIKMIETKVRDFKKAQKVAGSAEAAAKTP